MTPGRSARGAGASKLAVRRDGRIVSLAARGEAAAREPGSPRTFKEKPMTFNDDAQLDT